VVGACCGDFFAVVCGDQIRCIRLSGKKSAKGMYSISLDHTVRHLCCSTDGVYIATYNTNSLSIYTLQSSGLSIYVQHVFDEDIVACDWCINSHTIAIATGTKPISIHTFLCDSDGKFTPKHHCKIRTALTQVQSMSVRMDGGMVALLGHGGDMVVARLSDGCEWTCAGESSATCVSWHPQGMILAVVGATVRFYDICLAPISVVMDNSMRAVVTLEELIGIRSRACDIQWCNVLSQPALILTCDG